MDEKHAENDYTHCQVWVESEEETRQFMKRLVFSFLIFMISLGVAWAGERGYQLVAGGDSKFCASVLEVFREEVDDRWQLRYQHEIFRQITWRPVELRGLGLKTRHCSSLNNSFPQPASEELWHRRSGCR